MKKIKDLFKLFIVFMGIFSGNIVIAASLTTPVIDHTQTLNQEEQQTLNKELWQWYNQGLMQGALVIVKTTGSNDIFDYGMDIFERWKLGSKENNNGLLMIIAKEDHKIWITTGYGLEGALPDISIKRIIDQDITPKFKQNAYFLGIKQGFASIVEQLKADPEIRAKMIAADKLREKQTAHENFIGGLFPIFIIIFNAFLNLILKSIKILKRKGGKRFFISLLLVATIVALTNIAYNMPLSTLIPPAIMAIIIGSAIGNKGRDKNFRSGSYIFPRGRDDHNSFSNSSEQSYNGGGGSSGGGGAGGSW